jgi:RNA polymerase sigma factor (TIGR02999 family)
MSEGADYTLLLQRASSGDAPASAEFFRRAYAEMRALAEGAMREESAGHLLQPTALVHEAFLRIWREGAHWENRRHFFGAAVRSMRQILVDLARQRDSDKRGRGAVWLSLSAAAAEPAPGEYVEMLNLDALLHELEAINPRYVRLIELRHFAGFGVEETADLLAVSPATVKRDWAFARAWLLDRLQS